MRTYSLDHVSDRDLLRDLSGIVVRDRATTAELLAHIGEVDARRLYRAEAYPSMRVYCLRELHLSEHSAFKRITAARKAREFPAIFAAVADGRLHLAAVVLLAPRLTPENFDELLVAATHKTKSEIEELLAQRFPQADVPGWVAAIAPPPSPAVTLECGAEQHAPQRVGSTAQRITGPVDQPVPENVGSGAQLGPELVEPSAQLAPECIESSRQLAPGRVQAFPGRPRVTPLAPQRFALQVTIDQSTRDLLRQAQELLSHQLPSGDVAQVLERALQALVRELEKKKFAATEKPRRTSQRRPTHAKRHIPAHVKRAVRARDGGQCTFVSEAGRRCSARSFLEYDHIDEVARGGQATVERVRLRCRAHNQYEAECTFGAGFMDDKRQEARRAAAEARAAARTREQQPAAEQAWERDARSGHARVGP